MAEEQPPLKPGEASRAQRAAAVPTRPRSGRPVQEEEEPPRRLLLRRYPAELRWRMPCLYPDLPEQAVDREKCRSIRRRYRQLIHSLQQNREDIVNTASDLLTEALEEAYVLFQGVSRPREAALDAQFLVLASDLAKEKAKHLNSHMSAFNHVAFCDVLFAFMGLNWMKDKGKDLSDCDESEALFFWGTVQKEAKSWILRAGTFHFIVGSFKAESSARRPQLENHRRARRMEGNGDMPTKLRKLDPNANEDTTKKEVKRILGLLQTYCEKYPDTPVSYFEFVIDPNSFSRTAYLLCVFHYKGWFCKNKAGPQQAAHIRANPC